MVAFILKFGIIFALYRGIAKLVRHQVLILTFVGSSPATSAISKLGQSFVIDPIFLFSLTKVFYQKPTKSYKNFSKIPMPPANYGSKMLKYNLNWLC